MDKPSYDLGTTELALEIDKDVLKLLVYVHENIRPSKWVPVIELANKMAPILWGDEDRQELFPVIVHPHVRNKIKEKIKEEINANNARSIVN